MCLQVTIERTVLHILVATKPGSTCVTEATFLRSHADLAIQPDGSRDTAVNVSGQVLYSAKLSAPAGKQLPIVVTSACSTSGSLQTNMREVVLHAGDRLRTVLTYHPGPSSAAPDSIVTPTPSGYLIYGSAGGGGSASAIPVSVRVTPNPIPFSTYPTLTVQTAPSAVCSIQVRYGTGRAPTSYPDHGAIADGTGSIAEQGRWQVESEASAGTVTVSCTLHGANGLGTFSFLIAQ